MPVNHVPRATQHPWILSLAILSAIVLATPRPVAAADDPHASSGTGASASQSDVSGPVGATDPYVGATDGAANAAEKPYWRRNLFGRCFTDQKFLFTDWLPSEAHRSGFMVPILLATGVAFASARDSDASQPDLTFERDFTTDSSGYKHQTARMFTTLGDAPVGLLLIGTAYLTGRWSGHDRFAETASLSAEAVLDTGLWVTVLKTLTARTRPSGGGSGQFFQYHPAAGEANGSFPSGHASGAFAAASVFAGMYREQHPWVPWLAYGTASLVGVSRVALGRHFPTDVVVGGLIGDSFGRMVVARGRQEEKMASSRVLPFYDPVNAGEGVAWSRVW